MVPSPCQHDYLTVKEWRSRTAIEREPCRSHELRSQHIKRVNIRSKNAELKHVMLFPPSLDALLCDYVACTEQDSSSGAGSQVWATEEKCADILILG